MEQDPARARTEFKAQQTKHWNDVAGGWAARADWTERNFAPLTAWLQSSGCWRAGSRVLDVACGSGYPTIAAALAVGPAGRVVATDISTEMIAAAAARAHALGLANVEFADDDCEALRFETESFDAVTHTYGLMFCPDLGRAVGELHRVLRPGGRAAIVVWDEPNKNPYFQLMLTAAAPLLGLAAPTAGAPGPFRLASSETMTALLHAANFCDVHIEHLPMTFECESVDDYIQIFSDVAFRSRMARLTGAERARLRAAVADVTRSHVDDRGRVRLLTTSLCASGRRPSGPVHPG